MIKNKMIIIPAVNILSENDIHEILPKLFLLKKEKNIEAIHIDISDGQFNKVITFVDHRWFQNNLSYFNFFVHFMVANINEYLPSWVEIKNLKKISFHMHTQLDIDQLLFWAKKYHLSLELVYSLNDNLEEFMEMFLFYHCTSAEFLAVPPGPMGQKFNENILEKIKIFKSEFPHVDVFVDGGVNEKNISSIEREGVKGVVVGSYLWQSTDVISAYEKLANLK